MSVRDNFNLLVEAIDVSRAGFREDDLDKRAAGKSVDLTKKVIDKEH